MLHHYVRRRLRRRLFVWFGWSIVFSGLMTTLLLWLISPEPGWEQTKSDVRTFVGGSFGESPRVIAVLVGAFVLWGSSGAIAYRLTRPLSRLVKATRQIGEGNLDVEIRVGHHAVDELAELAEAMRDMTRRIAKQMNDQRELLAAVSHEIRTPLGHLRVLVDLARESGADAARLAEIEAEVLAIDAIVGRLIASSRLEFGTLDRRALDGVQAALTALERAGLDPTLLEASDERLPLQADAALIGQALANLLRNACEHGGGVAGLTVRAEGETVCFEVLDDGPGLQGVSADEAFAAFTAGASRKGGTLGLGLALVKRIAQAHDGTVWAYDRDEGGARIGFSCRAARDS